MDAIVDQEQTLVTDFRVPASDSDYMNYWATSDSDLLILESEDMDASIGSRTRVDDDASTGRWGMIALLLVSAASAFLVVRHLESAGILNRFRKRNARR